MTGSLYRSRIDADDASEVSAWAARLHVTPQRLRDAITRVGNWSDDIQFALNDGGLRHGEAGSLRLAETAFRVGRYPA